MFLINERNFLAACIVFGVAALTDFFDGYLARKWQAISEFGAMVDPLADKTLMILSYLALANISLIPFYVSFLVILRDVLILLAILFCKYKKIPLQIQPLMSSKINTAVQAVYVVFILFGNCFAITLTPLFVDICSWIVCASTVFSAIEYVRKFYWIRYEIFKLG
jgi:cardiolipin synthase